MIAETPSLPTRTDASTVGAPAGRIRYFHLPRIPVLVAVAAAAVVGPTPASAQEDGGEVCAAPEYRQFDFWIGDWDIVNVWKSRDQPNSAFQPVGQATNQVHAVAGGCGIVEHWQGWLGANLILGFSVRSYNAFDEEWDLLLLWPRPNGTNFSTLSGTFRHGRGEFFGGPGGDNVTRYSFSDITDDRFRWDDAYSADGGNSWVHSWIMEFTRRPESAAPLFLNAPAVHDFRCDDPAFREYDSLRGSWAGSAETADGEVRAVMTSVPILGGCAHMNLLTLDPGSDDPVEYFAIRALETGQNPPAEGRWVEWRMDEDQPVLHRLARDDASTDGLWSGERPTADGPVATRVRFEEAGDDRLIWTVEEQAPDGRWVQMRRVSLSRRF